MQGQSPLVAEVNLAAVRHNLALVRQTVGPNVRICPVVKANAYGHGVDLILPAIRAMGMDRLAVATLAEGIELRRLGWTGAVLIFGRPVLGATAEQTQELACEAVRHNLICTVLDREEASALVLAALEFGRNAVIHVKIDTGMSRAGLPLEHAISFVRWAQSQTGLTVEAVYTHFATSEDADTTFMQQQLEVFRGGLDRLNVAIRHTANTGAIFRLPASHFEMVRPGLGIYGYWPEPGERPPAPLRPCLRLVSRLTGVKVVPEGFGVGYGRTYVTQQQSTLGLVPIGYADGYLRSLSNRGVMTLRAESGHPIHVPVVGRVSMDQTIVDLTGVPSPRCGEPVVVIDDDPEAPNSVAALAVRMNTIAYEVTCGLGRRVQRVAVDRAF